MDMNGRVALVTGAAVGIGRATALLLAEYGADLVLLDVDLEGLQAVRREIGEARRVEIYSCDISNEARVREVVADALAQLGKIDILINNAAVWRGSTSFLETPSEEWTRYFAINVLGTAHVTRAVLPQMVERHDGRIVNVASVAGVYGNKNMSCYSATKGAIISFTKALAKEVAESGVTVNSVSPGTVSDSGKDDLYHTVPNPLSYMGRSGSDMENAELICFLCGDKAPYISGQNIQIDGCRKIL